MIFEINTDEYYYIAKASINDEKITDAQGNVSTNWKLIAEKDPTGQRYKSDARYDNAIIRVSGNTIYITRNCKEDGSIDNKQDYRIGKTFSQSYLNNTVKCTIRKNSLNYSATKEMSFGLMGTNGTDVTLVIDFDNNRISIFKTKGHSDKSACISINHWLFTGDTILYKTLPYLNKRFGASVDDLFESISFIYKNYKHTRRLLC